MKKFIVGFALSILLINAIASDLTIRFAAQGKATTVEKVRVDNTTKGTFTELSGSDALVLTTATSKLSIDTDEMIAVSPNPVLTQATLSFSIPVGGVANIKIIATGGVLIAERSDMLNAGNHTYTFGGIASGMYHAVVEAAGYTYSAPFVSEGNNSQPAYIILTSPEAVAQVTSLKSLNANISMAYSKGDVLKFKGTSGIYTALITDSPTESKTITFEFALAPVAAFTLSKDIARVEDDIIITDKSTNQPTKLSLLTGNGHEFLQHEFVEGTSGLEFDYYYPTRGLYTITMKVSNSAGSSEASKTIKIFNKVNRIGTIEDYQGFSYPTIKYGTQTWMVQNLRTTRYNDGTEIPLVTEESAWNALRNTPAPAYCNLNYIEVNLVNYGRLYNMEAVNTGKLCPIGWHVPTIEDWETLKNHLIAEGFNYDCTNTDNKIAKSMASTTGWIDSDTEGSVGNQPSHNNMAEFNAFPTGIRAGAGDFYDQGKSASWFIANGIDGKTAVYISSSDSDFNFFGNNPNNGRSVRCVKD